MSPGTGTQIAANFNGAYTAVPYVVCQIRDTSGGTNSVQHTGVEARGVGTSGFFAAVDNQTGATQIAVGRLDRIRALMTDVTIPPASLERLRAAYAQFEQLARGGRPRPLGIPPGEGPDRSALPRGSVRRSAANQLTPEPGRDNGVAV